MVHRLAMGVFDGGLVTQNILDCDKTEQVPFFGDKNDTRTVSYMYDVSDRLDHFCSQVHGRLTPFFGTAASRFLEAAVETHSIMSKVAVHQCRVTPSNTIHQSTHLIDQVPQV